MAPMVRAVAFPMRPLQSTIHGQCLNLRALAGVSRRQRRLIHLSTLKKRDDAEEAWKEQARLIQDGTQTNLWDKLKERGFIKDIAGDENNIREIMRRKRIGAYVGIDPTAASLHVGHLLPLMALFWMYIHGYSAFSIIGGSTAKVGDPTGRLKSREENTGANVAMYTTKTHYQMKRLWMNLEAQASLHGYRKEWAWTRGLLNNSQWLATTPFMEIVQGLFTGMRMGSLLSRETVKRKMEEGDGMSLSEFIYPLMQAWDWWHLYSSPRHVQMQIGGSDQYGNIVSGIDAVNYARERCQDAALRKNYDVPLNTPIGFTTPLLTDSSGAKFGKSAGNAVWLDPFMTSPFDFYAYFMRRPDADVEKLLKLLTFTPMDEINRIVEAHKSAPPKRLAQHHLAFEVCSLIHGPEQARKTRAEHLSLYSKGGSAEANEGQTDLSDKIEFYPANQGGINANMGSLFQPHIKLPESLLRSKSIARVLHAAGLADSVTEGHRLVRAQGAYIGGAPGQKPSSKSAMNPGEVKYTPVKMWFPEDLQNYLIDDKLLILRRGKHFIRTVEMVSDEEYEASGEIYPGQPRTGKLRLFREALRRAGEEAGVEFTDADLRRALTTDMALEMTDKPGSSSPEKTDSTSPEALQFPKGRPQDTQKARSSARAFGVGDEGKQKILNDVISKFSHQG